MELIVPFKIAYLKSVIEHELDIHRDLTFTGHIQLLYVSFVYDYFVKGTCLEDHQEGIQFAFQ